jgi:sec-independent protein translocase protein TatB
MEILGIGAPELIFILILALIFLGPKDMQKAGRTIGIWLNQLIKSDGWRAFQRTSREIRNLPANLMRQANMDDLRETGRDIHKAIDPNWDKVPKTPPATAGPRPSGLPSAPPGGIAAGEDPAAAPNDTESDA